MRPSSPAPNSIVACLLSLLALVSAFYPEDPAWGAPGGRRAAHRRDSEAVQSRGAETEQSLTLPLRRVRIQQRDSIYKIVPSKPPKQENSVSVNQDGSDNSYMVSVALGSSSKPFDLLLDSAASNTWVMGSNCKTEACSVHNTFGPEDSKTLIVCIFP
jgi:hypothetical protein